MKPIVLFLFLFAFSCAKKTEMEEIKQSITQKQAEEDSSKNYYKFTITATQVPYLFKRIGGNGIWTITTCTEKETVFMEPYVEPSKIIGGTAFNEYMFMASFNMTDNGKQTITIKCDHLGKTVTATNQGATVAMLQIKNLK